MKFGTYEVFQNFINNIFVKVIIKLMLLNLI